MKFCPFCQLKWNMETWKLAFSVWSGFTPFAIYKIRFDELHLARNSLWLSLCFTFYLRVSFFHVSYSLFLLLYIFAFCISQPNPLQAINLNLFCSLQFVRVVGIFLACLLWNLLAFHFYENWWYQQTVKWAGERESRERERYRLAFRTRFLFRHSILRLFCH